MQQSLIIIFLPLKNMAESFLTNEILFNHSILTNCYFNLIAMKLDY